jgi:hypothetical protein
MKKLSIFLLLSAVLIYFTYAIEDVGDFTVGVALEGTKVNTEHDAASYDNTPRFSITPSVTFSRDLIEGLNLFIGVNDDLVSDGDTTIGIPLYDNGDTNIQFVKLEEKITYSMAAGPGFFSINLRNRNNILLAPNDDSTDNALKGALQLQTGYTLHAGPGTFLIAPYTGFSYGENVNYYGDDFDYDNLGFDIGYFLDFGLSFFVSTWLTLPHDEDVENYIPAQEFDWGGAFIDISYSTAKFSAGLDVGSGIIKYDGDIFFPIKPYFKYFGFVQGLTVGTYIKIGDFGINGDKYISPGVFAIYSF